MRIAIVSDIHGNLPALDAVLADIAALGADAIVNLGDIASGPLWPRETLQRLMPLRWPTIAGNHERQLLALTETAPGDRSGDALAARAIGEPERAWLRGLPKTLQLAPGVEACHGTPGSDCTYLLETVTDDFGRAGSRGIRAATPDEVQGRLTGSSTTPAVLLCGHSHVPRVTRLDDGRLFVNPGSVGLPAYDDDRPWPHWVESDGPQARWAWIEERPGGWHAELCRSRYESEAAARRAESLGRGDWADALRTGRVGRTEAEVLGAATR